MKEYYNIIFNNEILYSKLTEEEYFNTMEDLANDFFLSGTPSPEQLKTEIYYGD